MSWIAVGVTAFSVVSQGMAAKKAGKQNARELEAQAAQNREDAAAEREASSVRANLIRKAGRYQQGTARAALARGGVVVDSGSGQEAQDYIKSTSEQDALTEILNGEYRAKRMEKGAAVSERQAGYANDAGRAALTGSLIRAGGTVAGGYAMAGGWKTQAPLINDQVAGQYSTVNRQYG